MKIIGEFKEDIFPYQGIDHERRAARGIVLDEQNRVALLRCQGPVASGSLMDCYLTPGGGMEPGESPEQAVDRELSEELGFRCEIIQEVGCVIDHYNNLKQRNVVHYYLAKALHRVPINRTEEEQGMIKAIEWLTIEDAIRTLETHRPDPRGTTLHRRDLCALKEAAQIIKAAAV